MSRKKINNKIILSIVLVVLFLSCTNRSQDLLFEKHTTSKTGIDFNNELIIDGELVVLDFEYMFNGAGVAVSDFDNDGLQDIYFTGNMVSNRMYKNLGNWNFKDITNSSNTGSTDWSNGVAVVDINQDGWKDIYVSKGGPRGSTAKERANLLFINKGIVDGELKFEEQASAYGLDDSSYSVQSTFFDYDGDGDLDMYLLCNALVDFNRNTSRPKDRNGKAPSKDKLFRNDGPTESGQLKFTDVSRESGILVEGFGLGVEVCDINLDGWLDIYVSNDFLTDDLLYINQKDGTFKNSISDYIKHLTFNGMGSDIGDINNDGLMDIVVLDMLPPDNKRWKLTMMGNNYDEHENGLSYGYQPQYIRNTLQVNNGNGSFSEMGLLANIAATEWSWGPLIADYDNDGYNDLMITNGYRQDITNLDFMVYSNQTLTMGTIEANKEARLRELNKYPGIKVHNYLYRNKGGLQFEDISIDAGFSDQTYSNGMAYADLDNDGDLDLVINNIDDPAGIFENKSVASDQNNYLRVQLIGSDQNIEGIGANVTAYYNNQTQKKFNTSVRGYLSTVEQTLHFGLGATKQLDSLSVVWPDGKQQLITSVATNQLITLNYSDANSSITQVASDDRETSFKLVEPIGVDFKHEEDYFVDYKIQALLPHMHSKNGPGISVSDVNGDNLEDFYIAGAHDQKGALFLQNENQSFDKIELGEIDQEGMGSLFFDADNDGDQDLYVVGGGTSYENNTLYQDCFYQNDGSGTFKKTDAIPESTISGSVVTAADYDKDGDLDLFVGGRIRPGEYPLAVESRLLENNSKNGVVKFEKDPQAINDVFSNLGMVTAALWTDFNNDDWQDLIVVGEFMAIRFIENQRGILTDVTSSIGLEHSNGWWNSINGGDFDKDGDTDYILGNLGLNTRYKASEEEPLSIYSKDFDKNGQIDPILCYYVDGENQISHSRGDLVAQISSMRGRFRTYSDYATTSFKESFSKSELKDSYVVQCHTLANSYLENLGDGTFKLSQLPLFAQEAPMYGILTGDYNSDGNLDILAVGNFYNGEVFTGRYDASIGWFLEGNGDGSFERVEVSESGFYIQEDAKSLVNLFLGDKELIISGINNNSPKIYEVNQKLGKLYRPNATDISARIQFKDGSEQKVEFYYGSGYLSSASRQLKSSTVVESISVKNSLGEETVIEGLK